VDRAPRAQSEERSTSTAIECVGTESANAEQRTPITTGNSRPIPAIGLSREQTFSEQSLW